MRSTCMCLQSGGLLGTNSSLPAGLPPSCVFLGSFLSQFQCPVCGTGVQISLGTGGEHPVASAQRQLCAPRHLCTCESAHPQQAAFLPQPPECSAGDILAKGGKYNP